MIKKWVSVSRYAKKRGKSPQVIYNWLANGKLKKDVDWREIEVKIKRKQILENE